MKFLKASINMPKDDILAVLSDSDFVNDKVKFASENIKPRMHLKAKEKRITLSCEMIGAPKKDNAFLEGTKFYGRITEKNGVTNVKGVILTAPIYHFIILCLLAVFIYQCFYLGGFSVVPICLLAFDIFMFKDEFKKQRLIYNYVFRAFRRAENYGKK